MAFHDLCRQIALAFDPDKPADLAGALVADNGDSLPAWFAVTDLARATVGMAGLKLARLAGLRQAERHGIVVDPRLVAFWFSTTVRPDGWQLPGIWDAVAGDYRSADGWIRLHTNAPKHRAAALAVLACGPERERVAGAVSGWPAHALEDAIVAAGGCAAEMRDLAGWAGHPQGAAVAGEPLVHWERHQAVSPDPVPAGLSAPLAGVRVLDLTRILAGPVATRFLAAFGADVLRIDPPGWDEPAAAPEVTLGKRCAGLDLTATVDRRAFDGLLRQADVLVHGYRPGALDGLGYGPAARRAMNPGLIDVSLNAYGWSGPWAGRRGFDSLVQMSSGIAAHGMMCDGAARPVPLPVQALDHGTGYLMAAAVLHALRLRRTQGVVLSARLSLARTARLLAGTARPRKAGTWPAPLAGDLARMVEETAWGPARRVRFPLQIEGIVPVWRHPAGDLRSTPPRWAQGAA